MADYTGKRCIVCSEQFNEDDDIVVCSECGTPYHRACYEKYGYCVNVELHKSGRSWKPADDVGTQNVEENKSEDDSVCPSCGYVNPRLTAFCSRCGSPMPVLERHNEHVRRSAAESMRQGNSGMSAMNLEPYLINFTDPLCGYNPDEDFDGVRLCELADYIGTNTHYYLPNFKRFKDTKGSMSWNFSAMLFPELFFAYRRMPLISLAAALIRFMLMIPQYIPMLADMDAGLLSQFAHSFDIRSTAFSVVSFLSYILVYAVMFFFGAYANKIYYRKAIKKTAKIKAETTPYTIRQTLRSKGGTSAGWLAVVIAVYVAVGMSLNGILGFFMLKG